MKIILSPQRRDDFLLAEKLGDVLNVNGFSYDFSSMAEGDTLPRDAFDTIWFAGDVNRVGGEIVLTLLFPNPQNYSHAQAFPVPLVDVPDGRVLFPMPNPDENGEYPALPDLPVVVVPGSINWGMRVTQAMKDAAANAAHLALMKAELASRNLQATTQIARIQDRIETIGYGIDIGEATDEEIAEQAALAPVLAAWKAYKFALGKVTKQPGWHANPVWPVAPAIPVIIADPQAKSPDVPVLA